MNTKTFKLSCQAIEKHFGKGNFDDAEAHLWDIIFRHLGNSDAFAFKNIDFEDHHPNPYFHTLNFEVEGIDTTTEWVIYKELKQQGLVL